MKKLFISALLACSTFAPMAQEAEEKKSNIQKVELPMMCGPANDVEKLIQQHKESAVFAGLDKVHGVENLTINLFRNENTGSYTMVFLSLDKNLVCILSAGEKARFIYKY